MKDEIPFRRWLLLTQYYHPEPGAPQIRLRALARELRRRGCTVDVVTAMPNYPTGRIYQGYEGKLWCTETIEDCKVRRLWIYGGAGRKALSRLLCYLSFSLAAALSAPFFGGYDVVFVEAQPISLAFAGLLCKALRGIPFIYNTPDLQVEIAGEQQWIGSRALLKIAAATETFLMRRSFCVATVTDSFVEHFAKVRGVDRAGISFLPNGADTDELRPMAPDHDYAQQLGVSGRTIFSYCGTLAHYHGLDVLIDAAAALREHPRLVILVAGKGPLGPELRARALALGLSNVVFVDSPFSEMRRLMSITTASLAMVTDMPAASKMRLSKVVPPLACGVPVVYVGQGEFANILKVEDCGWVVPGRNPRELADLIREIAAHPEGAALKGKRGRAYVEQRLSWSRIVDEWLDDLRCIHTGEDLWQHRARAISNARYAATAVGSEAPSALGS